MRHCYVFTTFFLIHVGVEIVTHDLLIEDGCVNPMNVSLPLICIDSGIRMVKLKIGCIMILFNNLYYQL